MRILATIGPASCDVETLSEFARHTHLYRLNGSHNNVQWHHATVDIIRQECTDAFVLMDLPGIKPRTCNAETIKISSGDKISFGARPQKTSCPHIDLTKPLPRSTKKINKFSIDDGQFVFEALGSGEGWILGRSVSSFDLLPRKGLNIPDSVYDESKQFEIYKNFITQVENINLDAYGLSFIQTGAVVKEIRKLEPQKVLISKIENLKGLENCEEIVKNSDAVMIDRGDLAAEIGLDDLYHAIEDIASVTKHNGKPLIMATENLDSMLLRSLPSKSEVISLAHSASIGVDCIMLSEETAISSQNTQIINWLGNFLNKPFKESTKLNRHPTHQKYPSIWNAIKNIESLPIILVTKSGYSLYNFFAMNPCSRVFLITANIKLKKTAQLYSTDITVLNSEISSELPIQSIWKTIKANKRLLFAESDQVAVIYVSKYVNSPRANSITIFDKNDF